MRRLVLSTFLCGAVLLPNLGNAQLEIQETYPPTVTAASAEWQINDEPIFYDGNYYEASGPTIFFDGAVMSRTSVWKGVPLYQDRTLEPSSVVFVPIGGNLMKPYDRRPEGKPGQVEVEEEQSGGVGTGGTFEAPAASAAPVVPIRPGRIESVPAPTGTRGVFINYNGAKWFLDGAAIAYSAHRFTPIGRYRGFPVYRDTKSRANRIWVSVVPNGPIAPYSKR